MATDTANPTVVANPQPAAPAPVIETNNTGRARFINLTKSEITIPMTDGTPLKIGIGRYNTSEEFEKKFLPKKHVKLLLYNKFIKYA